MVVGGLVTATALTLVLLPALYYLMESRAALRRADAVDDQSDDDGDLS